MTYKDQLKRPEWQKKRLEIMQRDNFQCQCCLSKEETLTVHHKRYLKNKKAWDYSDELLITLCEDCHNNIHKNEEINSNLIFELIKRGLSYTDFYLLSKRISDIIFEQELKRGYNTIIKLLLSQTIKKDQI